MLLPAETVERAIEAKGIRFRDCLFTPLITLWMFLAQVLSADGSCREASARLLAFLAAGKGQIADPATGPYCKARKRLSQGLVSRLAKQSGQQLHGQYPSGRLLGGRKVKVADGTFCSMPDTPENQKRWPQPRAQKPGLGFPLVRLMAVIALLLARGVDSLFRRHQLRKIDFRTGQRLGRDDHLIDLEKPAKPPEWMDRATYEQLPKKLTVRELRVRVYQKGFRGRTMVLVTARLTSMSSVESSSPKST